MYNSVSIKGSKRRVHFWDFHDKGQKDRKEHALYTPRKKENALPISFQIIFPTMEDIVDPINEITKHL